MAGRSKYEPGGDETRMSAAFSDTQAIIEGAVRNAAGIFSGICEIPS